jgi:hypothetical protein
MTMSFRSTPTQAEINGIISLFCHFYEHHEDFEYSPETIEFDTCKLQILNGIYSDEELIVETPLQIKITNEKFPCQNYYLAVNYYSYLPDTDDQLPQLQREYMPLTLNDGIAELDFDNSDVVYIMLSNWELVTKFDKPVITEVTS